MRSERLLICLKSFIGDAIMAVPMLEALESQYSHIAVQTSPVVQRLLGGEAPSRQFLASQTIKNPLETFRLASALRKERFGTVVLVNRSFRAALIARLAGIPVRIGHAREGRSSLLTKSLPYLEDAFEAESCLELARVLGCDGEPRPALAPSREESEAGREAIRGARVGIQPGARYPGKQLPIGVVQAVARRLSEDGHRLALLGGPEERASGQALLDDMPDLVDLVGTIPIRTTLGAVANLGLVLGADTGLMHVAAAAGAPTVTVFGPTNDRKWGHRYPPHHVLVAPDRDMSRVCVDELYTAACRALEG